MSGLPVDLYIREKYIERIRPFIGKSLIKVLTGMRRVGKSYILFQLISEFERNESGDNIIYLNLEDFENSHIRTAQDLHEEIKSRRKEGRCNRILIDEVQEVEGFERVVRSLALDPANDVYITGSNAKMLSGELATFLSGRYIQIEVMPLDYREFLDFNRLEDSDESCTLYCRFGGMPYLNNLKLTTDVAYEYLKSVASTIVFKDILTRYEVRDAAFLQRLIAFIAENIGDMFSAKKISDYLKSQRTDASVKQIQNYVSHLCNAYMVSDVRRFNLEGKSIFAIGSKYYFNDIGIRNSIVGYRIDDFGNVMENMVCNHLLTCGYEVYIGDIRGREIDFVGVKDNELVYIQVAVRIETPETARREFGNLLEIKDNYPKYVITKDGFEGNTHDGIRILSLRQFLRDFN